MNMIWLCITLLLISSVISDLSTDTSQIRVFPGENQSIAGVLQVTKINYLSQPKYAFNASEARELCESLRLKIASKAQVQEALSKGLETCRFGWIDEHLAVVPRIKASLLCGRNQTGLVSWRASVSKKFDVFCFNESETQLKDTTTDGPLTSSNHVERTLLPTEATAFSSNHQAARSPLPSPSPSSLLPLSFSSSSVLPSSPHSVDDEAESAQYMGTAQGAIGGPAKIVLITLTCGLLLIAVAIFAYIKRKRSCSLSLDTKQQEEYVETEEWTCVKNIKEPKKDEQEDIRVAVSDKAM